MVSFSKINHLIISSHYWKARVDWSNWIATYLDYSETIVSCSISL